MRLDARGLFCVSLIMTMLAGTRVGMSRAGAEDSGVELTIDAIFSSHDFDEQRAPQIRWCEQEPAYYIIERSAAPGEAAKADGKPSPGRSLRIVKITAETGEKHVLVSSELLTPKDAVAPIDVDSFTFSRDESKVLIFNNTRKVWRQNTRGDYWVLDIPKKTLVKIGRDAAASTLMFAKLSPDGNRVGFVRENDLYMQELSDLSIRRLTTSGSETCINGTSDWVNEEELALRDAWRWSPDSGSIAFWQFDTTGVRIFQMINNTEKSYPTLTTFPYPKVGEMNSAVRVGVVNATGGDVRWINLPGDPREHYIPRMEWTNDNHHLLIQQMNRPQNRNRVFLADPHRGHADRILEEQDDAWIENENPFRLLKDGREFLWLSERSGWRQIYRFSRDDQQLHRVTEGDFDVIDYEGQCEAENRIYFAASPIDPTQRALYGCPRSGGPAVRLTPADQPGWHSYQISGNGKFAVHTRSRFLEPPTIELVRLPEHTVVRTFAENAALRKKLDELAMPTVEFLKLKTPDCEMDAWCLGMSGATSDKSRPVLFHVYGEPHGQTVRDAWQGKRGMWHWMLAQQGYYVVSMDNRGTPVPKGRAWRKSVYKKIGILASDDQAGGARSFLETHPAADPARVGIWGWSGGGSMSLNMIFRHPELYQAAIAVAPMSDMRLYDTIYQERYMGLLDDNEEGYKQGSPVTFAGKLAGKLLIVHGTGDDNCHYQATERLMNQLIVSNKQFAAMAYPNRSHAISEGANTTRHFYGLLTGWLHKNLPTTTLNTPDIHRQP